jgi:HEAT repeat protein
LAAQQHPDDAFASRLVAIATDTGLEANARVRTIYALAANRTDESVKALKVLLTDSNERIRSATKQAINTAYHYRGVWTGQPLKPDDFDEATRNGH